MAFGADAESAREVHWQMQGMSTQCAEIDKNGAVRRYVVILGRRGLRLTISAVWLLLSVGGLVAMRPFIRELQSSVPPVEGTPSYDAQQQSDYYFPVTPVGGAMLLKTMRPDAGFVQFDKKSTCALRFSSVDSTTEDELRFRITCEPSSSNAGVPGCITTSDITHELSELVLNASASIPLLRNHTGEIVRVIANITKVLPNVTQCPVAAAGHEALTSAWLAYQAMANATLSERFAACNIQEVAPYTLPEQTFSKKLDLPVPLLNVSSVSIVATLPAGELWQSFNSSFFRDGGGISLLSVSTTECDGAAVDSHGEFAKSLGSAMVELAENATSYGIYAQVSMETLLMDAIREGIEKTLDLSTMTLPVALLILACMVRNVRLVVCTVANLLVCTLVAILVMYAFLSSSQRDEILAAHFTSTLDQSSPSSLLSFRNHRYPIAKAVTVPTVAPSLMIAVSLAMSIDYSLFLLARFQQEIQNEASVEVAVTTTLETSGKIIVVSGATLLLCFLMMLVLPVQFISSLGVSASVTVFMAVAVALTLTPTLLLSFPGFFTSDRRYGLSGDGCLSRVPAETPSHGREGPQEIRPCANLELDGKMQTGDPTVTVDDEFAGSCWPAFGRGVHRFVIPIIIALLACAVPLAYTTLPDLKHSCGLLPLTPTDADATSALVALQESFGVGTIYPTTFLIVPRTEMENIGDWKLAACEALKKIAVEVNGARSPGTPEFTAKAFAGVMILDGECTLGASGVGSWSHRDSEYSATKVAISYSIDVFSADGQEWIKALRTASKKHPVLGAWYVEGAGPIQMDVSDLSFERFPVMVGAMMIVVVVVIGASVRSLVAPVRAVICLLWMLAITFGLAVLVFQNGALSFLGATQLGARPSGAMNWMSPCMAFPVVVGLGLDYDIFFTERVLEERKRGFSEQDASIRALAATANTISAAGLIMVIAFSSLLLSTTPTLNEIAFLLIVGVLIDCGITTKIIIPAANRILSPYNFWPYEPKVSGRPIILEDDGDDSRTAPLLSARSSSLVEESYAA